MICLEDGRCDSKFRGDWDASHIYLFDDKPFTLTVTDVTANNAKLLGKRAREGIEDLEGLEILEGLENLERLEILEGLERLERLEGLEKLDILDKLEARRYAIA